MFGIEKNMGTEENSFTLRQILNTNFLYMYGKIFLKVLIRLDQQPPAGASQGYER